MKHLLLAAAAACLFAVPARAEPIVGEIHLVAKDPTASLRAADHSDRVRVTVWYPAAPGAEAHPLVVGPPGQSLFDLGSVAADAPMADAPGPRPVILLSHGFGGTARVMAWFGLGLARTGAIVVAVDHPGNNARDPMTAAAVALWWDRVEDLRAALHATEQDARVGPHMDPARIGVAGFSAGGGTALVAVGARVDMARLEQFCAANPGDGICRPQLEFSPTPAAIMAVRAQPEIAAEIAKMGNDHAIPEIRAAFAMAPALVAAFDPASLPSVGPPVEIVVGDADIVAPPATNSLVAAKLLPHVELLTLPGIGHYDFLAPCTQAGIAVVPQCKLQSARMDRAQVLRAATAFFADAPGHAP